ncbi:hypothetical protein FJ417_03905 [Mesorhizobium sp. B3-1-7]|uniref:hypothetical protein n=1 Tax=Mesorhizobium sp. B3-1-7 TaxID=2589894 RepID=UPI001127EEFC|nr:hypothetical protein [Mesorhizobium sp. B3-1-7]TPI64054.1 hypothetical protein FJ417_03905 [Mesorhizobium sp. B3-1-7]
MDFLKPIQDNWAVVTAAPWAFVTFILLGLLLGRFWQNGVVSTLTGRLALRDDRIAEYERKLGAASPDEARDKMEALERRLQALEPRSLSKDQLDKMENFLARRPGMVDIVKDMGSPQASRLHSQLEKVFIQSGWQIRSPAAMGVTRPESGILFTTRTGDQISEEAKCAMDAFAAAGLPFERRRDPAPPSEQLDPAMFPPLTILVTDL